MNATELMALAMLLAVVGRWEHGEAAVPGPAGLVEIIFALLVIAFLDQGKTQPIARGFAWIFLAAVLLGGKSPLTGLVNIANKTTVAKPAAKGSAAGGNTPASGGAGSNKKGLL